MGRNLICLLLILSSCVQKENIEKVETMSTENMVSAFSIVNPNPVYVPNLPNITDKQIGFVSTRLNPSFSVDAVATDRNGLYDLFSPEAKFYIINMSTTWFWGDGTSSVGGAVSHTYAREAGYTLKCILDVGFRGGYVVRLESDVSIQVESDLPPPAVEILGSEQVTGKIGDPPEDLIYEIRNVGGKPCSVDIKMVNISNPTIPPPSWFSINPTKELIEPGQSKSCTLTIDWPNALNDFYTININATVVPINTGWYLRIKKAMIIPPTGM